MVPVTAGALGGPVDTGGPSSTAAPDRRELGRDDTLGILAMPGVSHQRSSAGLGWSRMHLSVQREVAYAAEFPAAGSHLLILHLDGPVEVVRGSGPSRRRRTVGAGGLFLHPAGRDLAVELGGPLRTAHLYLDASMVRDAAGRDVALAEELGSQDPLLEQLVLSLDRAVQQRHGTASRLYVDSLGAAVAAQLAERHAAGRGRSPRPDAGGLAARELRIAVDLMHDRLVPGVSLGELAGAVGLSESQFARAFKARTGQPPHRYLVGLRLDHAQRLLRTSSLSIAEVAAASGFAHQEHLTRVMRARRDVTPGAWRRSST